MTHTLSKSVNAFDDGRLTSEEIKLTVRIHDKAPHDAPSLYFQFMQGVIEAYRELTAWHLIEPDKNGFATDDALEEIFSALPILVKGDGELSLVSNENAYEWRGHLERKPHRYVWRKVWGI